MATDHGQGPPFAAPQSEATLREQMCEIGRSLWSKGMVAANDGNISALLPDGTILCTPTGVSKGFMTPAMLPVVDIDGGIVSLGQGYRQPSSEVRMHLRAYQTSDLIGAVVHAHSPYATAFAIKGEALVGKLMPESIVAMPEIPLAPYATPSTDEVPDSIEPFVQSHPGCLLEHHGAITWAGDLMTAYMAMERLEYSALMTYLVRQIDGERQLSPERIAALQRQFGIVSR
ncbi:MAG: class II aldolase family protein [Actinobacteria bacterium HGW-Actinobacteria-8]|nr:MAG: class II aldolase family protein [Actinobacteria bacterium HGW-Actinobacteria-8]